MDTISVDSQTKNLDIVQTEFHRSIAQLPETVSVKSQPMI